MYFNKKIIYLVLILCMICNWFIFYVYFKCLKKFKDNIIYFLYVCIDNFLNI